MGVVCSQHEPRQGAGFGGSGHPAHRRQVPRGQTIKPFAHPAIAAEGKRQDLTPFSYDPVFL